MSVAAALTCRSSIPWTRAGQLKTTTKRALCAVKCFHSSRIHRQIIKTECDEPRPEHTMTISRAGKMPRLARVLKKASRFCGCNVCEKAQNSFTKFTWNLEGEKKKDATIDQTILLYYTLARSFFSPNLRDTQDCLTYELSPFTVFCGFICELCKDLR